jgi:WD40 repeat protein
MKKSHFDNPHAVVSLEYFNEAKRFIAGFANGIVGIFDENNMEDCSLVRTLEPYSQHPELLSARFHKQMRVIVTAGVASGVARLWDYDTGKCEFELPVCSKSSER